MGTGVGDPLREDRSPSLLPGLPSPCYWGHWASLSRQVGSWVTCHLGHMGHMKDTISSSISFSTKELRLPCEVSPLHTNLQVSNFERCRHALHHCQVWAKLQLALPLLVLTVLQLSHLPSLLLPPVSDASWLFIQCQPLYASCCTLLLYFSRYYLENVFLCLFFICYLCEKNYKILTQITTDYISWDLG